MAGAIRGPRREGVEAAKCRITRRCQIRGRRVDRAEPGGSRGTAGRVFQRRRPGVGRSRTLFGGLFGQLPPPLPLRRPTRVHQAHDGSLGEHDGSQGEQGAGCGVLHLLPFPGSHFPPGVPGPRCHMTGRPVASARAWLDIAPASAITRRSWTDPRQKEGGAKGVSQASGSGHRTLQRRPHTGLRAVSARPLFSTPSSHWRCGRAGSGWAPNYRADLFEATLSLPALRAVYEHAGGLVADRFEGHADIRLAGSARIAEAAPGNPLRLTTKPRTWRTTPGRTNTRSR